MMSHTAASWSFYHLLFGHPTVQSRLHWRIVDYKTGSQGRKWHTGTRFKTVTSCMNAWLQSECYDQSTIDCT